MFYLFRNHHFGLRHFFHVKHRLDGLLNFSLSFGRVMVLNLHYPKYPTVPNALSGIPLLVCPVKHRQLHKGNAIHLNNQTKHGMSHFCQWLWLTYLFQSPLTTCMVTVSLFSVSRTHRGIKRKKEVSRTPLTL